MLKALKTIQLNKLTQKQIQFGIYLESKNIKGGESSSQFRWFTIAKIEL